MIITYKKFTTSMQKLGSLVQILGLVNKGLATQIDTLTSRGDYNGVVRYLKRENKVRFIDQETQEILDIQDTGYTDKFVLEVPTDCKNTTKSMCKSIW